jgi:hypothetical protein
MSGDEDQVMTRSRFMMRGTARSSVVLCGMIGLALALAPGCKQKAPCPALDDCGGEIPAGDWVLGPNNPSCSDDLYTPPPDPRLIQADIPVARLPPPEPALFDWCQLAVTGTGEDDILSRQPPFLFAESAPVGVATLHYETGGRFALSTTRTGTFTLEFPAFCMRAFGATTKSGVNVCTQLQTSLQKKQAKKYRNITCVLDDAERPEQSGCVCAFDLMEVQESVGRFVPQSRDTILHLSGKSFPEEVVYCHQGDRLQLTAAEGAYLFDRPGLRTMDLTRLPATSFNCTDRMQGVGEDGIDCGPVCPIMCSSINCNDMMQGPGEDGVDCGPNCTTKVCPPPPM